MILTEGLVLCGICYLSYVTESTYFLIFGYESQCTNINNMFGEKLGANRHLNWATRDFTYLGYRSMTGIYECYCKQYVTLGEAMSSSNICHAYYWQYLGGGSKNTTLLGMCFGITNNILAHIVRKIGKKIDFHSVKTQSAFVFCLTFGIFFMNSSLLSAVLLPQ